MTQQQKQQQALEIQEKITSHPLGSVLYAFRGIINQALGAGLFKDAAVVLQYNNEVEKLMQYVVDKRPGEGDKRSVPGTSANRAGGESVPVKRGPRKTKGAPAAEGGE
jgi:hypothetical protein